MDAIPPVDLESLSDSQAQRAVMFIYDQLPASEWSGGSKPSLTSFEALGDELLEGPPSPAVHLVEALLKAGNEGLKGALARQMLRTLLEIPSLRPRVTAAVDRARQPDMMALPLIVGACILGLSLCPRYESTETEGKRSVKWSFDPTGNAAVLLDKLAALVKSLPETVVRSLTGS